MDEPLSNLDAKLRVGMRASLSELHARLGVTTVYVTHDQVEAMTLGQRVAVMRDGRILQVDRPQRLYEEPQDLFVAAFIGSPAMNLVEAQIDGDEVVFGQFRVPLDPTGAARAAEGRSCSASGPRASRMRPSRRPGCPRSTSSVAVLEELGSDAHAFFRVDAPRITAEVLEAEDEATLLAEPTALFSATGRPADAGTRSASRSSSRVDPSRVPLLRPATGASLLVAADAARRKLDLTSIRGGATMTKQSETRERVLDLIERLDVGEAIPSERQLSVDLGVSRLTVRAALDELVREGYLERRRGAGTFVSEPKIAQELTMTSFTEDMRRRGMVPVEPDARAADRRRPARGSAASSTSRRRSRSSSSSGFATPIARRWRSRRCTSREALVPGPDGQGSRASTRSTSCWRSGYGDRDRRRHPDDRADGDERGGVRRARRPAPLAGVPVRADDAARPTARSSSTSARSTAATATGSSAS